MNTTTQPIQTTLQLQFLAPNNKLLRELSMPVVVRVGASVLQADVSTFLELEEASQGNYGWLRLKYTLPGDAEGITSVSRVAPEPFVMRAVSPYSVNSPQYRVQVFAEDPAIGMPKANVEITARLMSEDSAAVVQKTARTNSAGYAELIFDVPKDSLETDLELELTGKVQSFVRKLEHSVQIRNRMVAIPTTDKPIYQPGQKLRVRTLVFDQLRNASTATSVKVTISDPGGDNVFETTLNTSAFGEANAEWEIPENARPGTYQIQIAPMGGYPSYERVWVSRYDLPTFSVDVHQGRPYYVPGETAKVDIRADYLFGKPVPGAPVRVVREISRSWNYRELKWNVEEGEVIEGVTDREGRFHGTLDLEKAFRDLGEARFFRDLSYAAYVTDPSTGRTEQRRFSTRVTSHHIHLYVTSLPQKRHMPIEFYVTASYADGTPAVCDLEIDEVRENSRLPLGRAKTNKYGVAMVTGLSLSPDIKDDSWPKLELRARDSADRVGQYTHHVYPVNEALRVYTDKPIYGASEPIAVRIESSAAGAQLVLSASNEGRVFYSKVLQLSAGKVDAVIPTSKSVRGSVVISAYHSVHLSDPVFNGRQVLFPSSGDLEIESSSPKKTYAPGEKATLEFRVRNVNGSTQTSLLGVSIFDKAVDERARTDSEFGNAYAFCRACTAFFGYERRLPGLTRSDLDRVNRKQPIEPDFKLAAEVILMDGSWNYDFPIAVRDFAPVATAFGKYLQKRFEDLPASKRDSLGFNLPADEASLREIIRKLDPDFDHLRDPWDNPYRLVASVPYTYNRIAIVSAGADEIFNSTDDFTVASIQWPYFSEYGKNIRTAMDQYHERTGGFIRDTQVLKEELRRQGHDFDAWKDPNGQPFAVAFPIDQTRFNITVKSGELIAWTEGMDYTADLQPRVDTVLSQFIVRTGTVLQSAEQVAAVLRDGGISDNDLKDPWGHSYYPIFTTESGYFDSVTYTSAGANSIMRVVPVTQRMNVIRFRSAGPDGKEGTPDDFTAMTFLRPFSEQSTEDASPRLVEIPLLDPTHGAIFGAVIDTTGALIPGASVKVVSLTGREIDLITGAEGEFVLRNLDPGTYRVRVALPGFTVKNLTGVLVRAAFATRIVATLEVGGVFELVDVAASAPMALLSASASVGEVIETRLGSTLAQQIATPKLRDYFPETLLWQPSLKTGNDGRAQVRFKLADSMTTWKAVAIASTKDGRVATAEKEIVAFQPFFVEHDPPKFLTVGDQIALPVVVRNYLDRDQSLDLSMKSEDWFEPLSNASRRVSVKAGEFTREVFSFKASKPVKDGRQRITAQGSEASDAIEKTSTVAPFGREITQVAGSIFRGNSSYNIAVPADALPDSARGELKIYPNLMAHVVDAIEGIMRRPYGCAEQVISSAYPSLLYLNYAKRAGIQSDPVAQKAKRYLRIALQALRGYQHDSGGFSYWTRGEPDDAVTAYAIQFLTGAGDFIEFDDGILEDAAKWLLSRQAADGSWKNDPKLTAYIASVLSSPGVRSKDKAPVLPALGYLRQLQLQAAEPYTTASIALAALQSGDRDFAAEALQVLRSQVQYERDAAFWDLQTNTPFYSWGRAGRLEATAVVLRAFAAAGSDSELVDKGLLFLMRNKDRYGIWYSTQATVRVLDSFVQLVGARQVDSPGSATILVNGMSVGTVPFGTRQQPNNPVTVDISKFLKPGPNRIEIQEKKKTATATVQLVESHYIPWNPSASDLTDGALRYSVRYSQNDAGIGDVITVRVEAERIGFRGYGMMLAEIGLPPGAEVDRESLADALAKSGWDLSRYDILPDRVIAYLWPRAGGTTFEFKFRPRYGVEAHTPASMLYDYYNPDAYSILLPQHFRVQ
jgi:hypothetical protein